MTAHPTDHERARTTDTDAMRGDRPSNGHVGTEPGRSVPASTRATDDALTRLDAPRARRVGESLVGDGSPAAEHDKTDSSATPTATSHRGRPSIATQIVQLVQTAARELCHDGDGNAYIRYGEPHIETWPLDSRHAREWISHAYYRTYSSAPRAPALADAIATLSGIARYTKPQCDIHLRTAYVHARVIHDVCDDHWRAVTITSSGWSINASPVIFRRPAAARAIPEPVYGGAISDVIDRLDLPTVDAYHVISWIVATIIGDAPVPVLELSGPAGAGKTTLLRRIRSMVDPHEADARAAPRSVEDLYVSARHSYVVAADNISHVSPEMSDALCVLCTGGGYARRTLYTTDDETVLRARRPIIVTGVTPIITASDLLDRAIAIALRVRDDVHRDTEVALAREWESALPAMMGAIYDTVAAVLRERSATRLPAPPRMADYAVIGETVSRICGWTSYADVYTAHRRDLAARGVESSPVATALLAYLQSVTSYAGPVGVLAAKLQCYRIDSDAWPRSARGVADAIRRAAPGLASAGLIVEWDPVRRRDGYQVTVRRGPDWISET